MDKALVWAMFYSSIAGFQYHPKNKPDDRMSLAELAKEADEMLIEYLRRFN